MLNESEKSFDRNTANETLKLIVKLGFKIIKAVDICLAIQHDL